MRKFGIGVGIVAVLLGVFLMLTGQRMCRTSCWIDGLFKLFLPKDYEYLAGGLPSFFIGVAIILYSIWRYPRRDI